MRTTEQVLREQQQDADRGRQPVPTQSAAPAPATSTAVAPADDRAMRNRYLEQIAGGMPGRLIKFSTKVNKFVTIDDGSDAEDVDTSRSVRKLWSAGSSLAATTRRRSA